MTMTDRDIEPLGVIRGDGRSIDEVHLGIFRVDGTVELRYNRPAAFLKGTQVVPLGDDIDEAIDEVQNILDVLAEAQAGDDGV